ncbi:hypothetical protein O181_063539 [Austropuccinia psidii MF-1]|uniref:Uncharacterized protein n=1 Tax=Austropuccinia psidii MF-1 TaxID=1389203 RepID=A0A9Q3I2N4_9BASI|nr:hypothetical protein [Austropuccinia psidii MF-1]
MLQPPTEGEFQTLELLWQHVHNVARAQGHAVFTLRSNMTHNQIEIGCDRSGTLNPKKILQKQSLQESLTVHLHFMPEKMPRVPLALLKSKILTIAIMPLKISWHILLLRKFSEQYTSQIAQMSESLLMPRKIQTQLCSHRESDRPLILQDI